MVEKDVSTHRIHPGNTKSSVQVKRDAQKALQKIVNLNLIEKGARFLREVLGMLTFSGHLHGTRVMNHSHSVRSTEEPTIRKNEAELTSEERRVFTSAIRQAVASGLYSKIVWDHAEIRHRHHSIACPTLIQRFLPWYRNYLLKFEEAMRAFEPRFSIPYWDWAVGGSIPNWLALFAVRGICDLNGKEIRIERARHAASDMAVRRGTLDRLMAHTDYISFSKDLESVHNCVHAWTGGTMDDVMYSPADPIFWLHHAQCDRIWWSWERNFPAEGPALEGCDQILDPWHERASDVVRPKVKYAYASAIGSRGDTRDPVS